MRRLASCVVAVVALSCAGQAGAQTPDLSGAWELSADGRNVPAARLAARVTRAMLADVARKDARSMRWCHLLGMPFTMGQSRPIDIRQGTRYVTLSAESAMAPTRYLYLSRRTHIPKDEYEPTTSGDSIATWEGDTLVVDTVGFSPNRGMLAIPGGGFRTADSHLVERFRLLKGGAILSVTSTWTDAKVFRVPHTYEYRYTRLPAGYEARPAIACDPFDADRAAFLEKPAAARR